MFRYCVLVVLAACQPMYGGPPAKLKTPSIIKHVEPPDPVAEVKYVETCNNADFRAPNKNVSRDPLAASKLVQAGDATVASAEKATADDAKRELLVDSVLRYRSALQKDPYDPDATLKLALAYDRVLRKGCALALLRRLNALSTHPKFSAAAEYEKDQVRNNRQWFGGYRSEALKEIP